MEIPDELKKHNGIFYEEAKSGDPTYKLPGCEKLIENLIAAMRITGNREYDEILQKCSIWAGRAHYHYYEEKDVRLAMDYCNAIMRELTVLCYDKRYVASSPKSFTTGLINSV